MPSSAAPLVYELNARIYGRQFDDITQTDLAYFRSLGFTHIWLMGLWRISPGALAISKRYGHDFEGSPYAVPTYDLNPMFGDDDAFLRLRERSHKEGLRLIVDFVPNHTAFDSPWIDANPDFYIRWNPEMRDERPEWYFSTPSGYMVAHGRDPYFPPWIDTAQLDYSNPNARKHMTDVLRHLATIADGVRCDMAMLLLREQIKRQWYPKQSWEAFNERMPDEFWRDAIAQTRRINPEFIFVAEAYWGKEPYLLELGFDYTYNKTLYDRLVGRGWDALVDYLELTSREFLVRSLHFIENHDEERAQHVFGPELHRQAAALVATLPGAPLIHQGQMEGRREKLPVQLTKPRLDEPDDPTLKRFYERLLRICAEPVFRSGKFHPFDSGTQGLVSFFRHYDRQRVLVAIDFREGRGLHASHGHLSIPGAHFKDLSDGEYRIKDLWSGAYHRPARLRDGRMIVDLEGCRNPDTPFFILEILA